MSNNKNNDKKIFFNYEREINKSVLFILKQVLKHTSSNGLPGEHHFYIKINTQHQGFNIQYCNEKKEEDSALKNKYPTDITIVLQNSFRDLQVYDDYFSVVLNFSSQPRIITVPFNSIITFHDPHAQFVVHLEDKKQREEESIDLDGYETDFLDDEDEMDECEELIRVFTDEHSKIYKEALKEKLICFDSVKAKLKEK